MTDPLQQQLRDALGVAYTITRELSGGGMSRVFLAEEVALNRRVVVKILPEDFGHSVSVERFKREIALAARLTHPHIVPLLTAGDAGGRPYYVMPYVDGETLRARMARGVIPLYESVRLLRQVVSALGMAHDHGIVHRDIKPENVLLAGDAAFITDFGVAKALVVATTADSARGLTETGLALGTPAYMAPEQALGEETVDQRADIYSLGCVAYEMLAGTPPFKASSSAQMLAAHVHATPAPLESQNPNLPLPLARLVIRCLEKDPGKRPSSAQAIAEELDSIPIASGANRLRWFQSRGPSRLWKGSAGAVTAVLVVLFAVYAVRMANGRAAGRIPLLAVLPFDSEGPDSTRYFVDGLGGAISDRLASVAGVRVIDHQSAIAVAKPGTTAKQMGTELGADYVLRGAVRWDLTTSTKRAQLTVSLINVSDGTTKWHGEPMTFVPASDPFEVQRNVSTAVAQALDVALTASDRAALGDRPTNNPAAYDAYLRGLSLNERAVTETDDARAAAYMAEAVRLDPGFQLARARWVDWQVNLLGVGGPVSMDSMQRAVDVLHRSAPESPTTLYAEAMLARARGDFSALSTLRRAAIAAPNNPIILYQTGAEVLWYDAHPADAWPFYERAVQIAPRSIEVLETAVIAAMMLRRLDDFRTLIARLKALDPANPFALYLAQLLAAAEGDTLGVIESFVTARASGAHPLSAAAPLLLFGGVAAHAILTRLSLADLAAGSPLSDTVSVFYAQGLAYLVQKDTTAARRLFTQAYKTSVATALPGNLIGDATALGPRVQAAAALGDHAATERALNTLRDVLRDFPSQSAGGTGLACSSAEAFAWLQDTTAMYPMLERCVTGPSGWFGPYYPAMMMRYPVYAPYREQPHFHQIVRMLSDLVKHGG